MIEYLKIRSSAFESNVRFVGRVPHSEIVRYLTNGDIFVYPSHYESFGIVCCEAMAAGKAVIGSRNGGMAEMINHEESGILIEPGNPLVIACAVIDLIVNNDKRLRLGAGARRRIEALLNPKQIIAKQISSYQRAIDIAKPNVSKESCL